MPIISIKPNVDLRQNQAKILLKFSWINLVVFLVFQKKTIQILLLLLYGW